MNMLGENKFLLLSTDNTKPVNHLTKENIRISCLGRCKNSQI